MIENFYKGKRYDIHAPFTINLITTERRSDLEEASLMPSSDIFVYSLDMTSIEIRELFPYKVDMKNITGLTIGNICSSNHAIVHDWLEGKLRFTSEEDFMLMKLKGIFRLRTLEDE